MRINKSFVLTAIGCVGTVVTAIMAVKESKKILECVDGYSLPKKVWTRAKEYKFTCLAGGLTIASNIASCAVSARALAGMAVGVGGVIANRDALQRTVRNYTGFCMDDVMAESAEGAWRPDVSVEKTGYGNTLCYFAWSGRWFESSEDHVREQLRLFNEELTVPHAINGVNVGGCAPLNDVYDALGMTPDQLGDEFGFSMDYYYDEDDPDRKDGVIFHVVRLNKWRDNSGIEHDTDMVVIYIDEQTLPFECFWEV